MRVGVRVSDPALLPMITPYLPPGWQPSRARYVDHLYSLVLGGPGPRPGLRRFHLAYGGPSVVGRSHEVSEMLDAFAAQLHLTIAEHARGRTFVHAGVVGWSGKAIIIPGHTESGKTTLVQALLDAGAAYYSDEYASVDAEGLVHPFPRPLGVRKDGTQRRVAPDELAATVGTTPLPIGLIFATRFVPDARWRPRRLTPGQGVLELLRHTVPVRRNPVTSLQNLTRAVQGATILRGSRGEAMQVAPRLMQLVGRHTQR